MKTIYAIKDRRGEVRAYHVRVDHDDGTKVVSWRGPDRTSGLNGTPSADLPLYNAHRIDEWADPIVVTEGEKAALALADNGFPAVGTVTGASDTPTDDVLADLEGRGVILWPDADDVGREHMRRIGESLVDRAAVGWYEPPDSVAKGWDAADAIADEYSIADELAGATPFEPAPPRVRVLTGMEFLALASESDDVQDVVEDFIQEEGLYFHVGDPGTLKTMLALQLGSCVSHGLPFLGMHTVQTNVVYFGFEGTQRSLAQRMRQQLEGLHLDEPGFSVAFKEPVMLDDREALDDWCEAVERHAPCMLIVDPFAETHTSDEVKDGSVLLGGLRRLQRAAGGPLWVLHHPNQDTKSAKLNRVRGHGTYVGAADAVYWQDRPDHLGTKVDISAVKLRDIDGADMRWLEFDPETCLFVPTSNKLSTRLLAIELVKQAGRIERATLVKRVATRTGKTERGVRAAIDRAEKAGDLVVDPDDTVRLAVGWEVSK